MHVWGRKLVLLYRVNPLLRQQIAGLFSGMESLLPQTFAGNALNRTARRDPDFMKLVLPDASLLLLAGRRVCVQKRMDGKIRGHQLKWITSKDLENFGLRAQDGVVNAISGTSPGEVDSSVHPFLLGQEASGQWRLAVEVGGKEETLNAIETQGLQLEDLRSLLPSLPTSELAIAGQAVALCHWHLNHIYCGRCGGATVPIEAGTRRQCAQDPSHKEYPRTDPVAIMLVESADGQRALLGAPKALRSRGAVLTCLSGFIEQGESIEEAVRREVQEEAGVSVGPVNILGSQPWPIGRGGSCELMVGCIAKAEDDTLHPDFDEMSDVRWVDKADLLTAIAASTKASNPLMGGKGEMDDSLDFFIPPPWAIAHSLIKTWAIRPTPWFSKL